MATDIALFVLLILIGTASGAITVTTPGNVDVSESVTAAAVVYTPTQGTGTVLWSATITPSDGKFGLHYNNGSLYYNANPGFDFETTASYTVSLTATDVDSTDTKTYTVTILNANESPVLTNLPATVAIEENWNPTAPGELIFTLAGTDPDAATTLTYTIDSVTPSSGTSYFDLDTSNQLKVRAKNSGGTISFFDHEAVPQFNLTIKLSDGALFVTKLLTVDIIDLNEEPFFNQSVGLTGTCDYDEELPVGTELNVVVPVTGEIRAYDNDTGDVLTYELDGQDQQFFSVQNVNGVAKIYMAQRADYELRIPIKTLTMNVRARDKAGRITEPPFVVTMKIQNKNDNLPVCSPTSYSGTVTENMAAGSTVLTLTCTDDDGPLDSYEITDFTTPDTLFEANATTHALLIKSPPDLEQDTVLTFNMFVVQGLPDVQTSSTVTVTVSIDAANDNRPTFAATFYNFDIRYDAAIASSVGKLSATDNDVTSSTISYDWVSTIHQFRLDPVDGRIRVQAAMTENTKWILFAVAKDNDSPPDYSDHVPVRIDAFPPAPYLVDFVVSEPISYFTDTRITEFLSAISAACSPCVARFSSMVSTPGEESTKTTLTVYALTDSTTNSFSNIEVNKYYVTKESMLAIFASDGTGTPSSATTTTAFHPYPVTQVSATINAMTAGEWLTQTAGGIAVLTILCALVVGGVVAGIVGVVKSGVLNRAPIEHNVKRPENLDNEDLFDYRYKQNNLNKRY